MSVPTYDIEQKLLDDKRLKDLDAELLAGKRKSKTLMARYFGGKLEDAMKAAKKINPDKSDIEIFIEFAINNGCYKALENLMKDKKFNEVLPNLNRGNGISYETLFLLKLASRKEPSINSLVENNQYLKDLLIYPEALNFLATSKIDEHRHPQIEAIQSKLANWSIL